MAQSLTSRLPTIHCTAATVAGKICTLANQCIAQKNRFSIVLAGGETPRAIYAALRNVATDWQHWHVYFGDERCLPPHDPQRNDTMAHTAWLSHVAIPAVQIHNIPAEWPANICTRQYAQTLAQAGRFDLVLLGLGEDGHTASLFPGQPWGESGDAPDVLAVNNAPKLPAQRITLSAHRLSQADQVWFLVTVGSKQQALQRWASGESLPVSAIKPQNGIQIITIENG